MDHGRRRPLRGGVRRIDATLTRSTAAHAGGTLTDDAPVVRTATAAPAMPGTCG